MKNLNIKLFAITAIFVCTVSASMAQKTAKEVIKYAKSIVDMPVVPLENASCLIAREKAYISSIDGKFYTTTALLVSPGTRFLGVQYSSRQGEYTQIIPLEFNFVADKYYYLDYEIVGKNILSTGSIRFFITEITDINQSTDIQEKARIARVEAQDRSEWVSYPKSNPYRFEGTWKGRIRHVTGTYDNQYIFAEDKMTFESKKGGKPYIMEGRVSFNENTIVFVSEKITANGKEAGIQQRQTFVWYYTLIDGVLRLEGGDWALDSRYKIDGEYRKIN